MQHTTEHTHTGKLIITRHCESVWNKLGLWTGCTDVHLTEDGFAAAKEIGKHIKNLHIDEAIVSGQVRTHETFAAIEEGMGVSGLPVLYAPEINERDYGLYTGKNKFDMEKEVGEEKFCAIRRGWDCPVPQGETLKMVYDRVIPFYLSVVLPKLLAGKDVLMVSHGNSIRALMKYLDKISDEDIANTEMPFNEIFVYTVDTDGYASTREVITITP